MGFLAFLGVSYIVFADPEPLDVHRSRWGLQPLQGEQPAAAPKVVPLNHSKPEAIQVEKTTFSGGDDAHS
jgi:hypothetical protein